MESFISNVHIDDYYAKMLKGKDLTISKEKSWKLIRNNNKERLDFSALSEGSRKVSYGEMFEKWEEVARVFSALNITRDCGSRVLTIMPNLAQTCHFDYGSDMTGAVCDFVDPTTSIDKIEQYIKNEKVTDIVISDLLYLQNMAKSTKRFKSELGIRNIILYKDMYLNSLMPNKIKMVSSLANKVNKFSKDIIRYEDAVRNSRYTSINYDKESSDSLSIITHTSGTSTGIGKPIPITDYNRNALVKNYELAQFNYEPGMSMMHFIPYFAGYGAVNTVHLGLTQGLELQQIPLFSPKEFGDFLAKCKSNIVLATASCWLGMINNPKFDDIDLSFLVYASVGGGPLTIEEEQRINEFLLSHGSSVLLTKGYGLSELCGCCIVTLDSYNRVGSIGVRQPLVDVKLESLVDGRILDSRECGVGELIVNSDTITCDKLDDNHLLDFVNIDGKKFLRTKDVVEIKEDGSFEYVERRDRMFPRYDGYNVYPLNLEKIFKDYDEVVECVIVPIYDEDNNGFVPKVYLETNIPVDNKEEFINGIIEKSFLSNEKGHTDYIANYREIPRGIVFVNEIPKNTMDKNRYGEIKNNGLDGEEYKIYVEEDNASVRSIDIYPVLPPKRLLK